MHHDQDAEQGHQDSAHDVADDHRQAPVEPVGQRARGQLQAQQGDLPRRSRHPGKHRRVSQRQDEQRVGEPADLGAGIGCQLADPQHPKALVTPQRNQSWNIGGCLDSAGVAHAQNSTHAAVAATLCANLWAVGDDSGNNPWITRSVTARC